MRQVVLHEWDSTAASPGLHTPSGAEAQESGALVCGKSKVTLAVLGYTSAMTICAEPVMDVGRSLRE